MRVGIWQLPLRAAMVRLLAVCVHGDEISGKKAVTLYRYEISPVYGAYVIVS